MTTPAKPARKAATPRFAVGLDLDTLVKVAAIVGHSPDLEP